MAFLLRDRPHADALAEFGAGYPGLDPAAAAPFLRVLRAGSVLLARLDRFLAKWGLSHGRWVVLVQLARRADGRARPSDLAARQGVTKATMTGLLAGLEGRGLVTRAGDPADGRNHLAEITPAGRRLLAELMPAYHAEVRRWMGPLAAAEQAALAGMLDRLLRGG